MLVRLGLIIAGLFMVGCEALAPADTTPADDAPVAIDDVFTMPSASHITLAWDDTNKPQEVAGYYLYYRQSGWDQPRRVDVGKQTTYTLTGLKAGQTYTFTVTAYGEGKGESPHSNTVSQRIPEDHERRPHRLTVEAPGVLANDYNLDGDALKALLVSSPTHGTVTLMQEGGFTYEAHANFSDSDSFTYQVTDGTRTSNVATVTLLIAPPQLSQQPASDERPDPERFAALRVVFKALWEFQPCKTAKEQSI